MNRRVIDKIRILAVALCALSVVSFGQSIIGDPGDGTGEAGTNPPGGFEFTPGKPRVKFPHDQKWEDLRYDPDTGDWTNPNGTPFDPNTIFDAATQAAWAAMSTIADLQQQLNALGDNVESFLGQGGTFYTELDRLWTDVFNEADNRYEEKKDDDGSGGKVTWDNIEGKPDPLTVGWSNVTGKPDGATGSARTMEHMQYSSGTITHSGKQLTFQDGLCVAISSRPDDDITLRYDHLSDKPMTKAEWEEHESQNARDVEHLTEMIAALNDGILPAAATNLLATVAFSGSYNDLSDAPEFGGSAETTVVNKDGDNFTFVMKNIIVTNGMLQATDVDGDGITLKKLASTAAWADIENKPSLYTTEEVDALIEANKCTCTPGSGGGSSDGECHCEGCGGGGDGGGSSGGNCTCLITSPEEVNEAEIDPYFTSWEISFNTWQNEVNTKLANLKRMQDALYDLVQTLASQAMKPGILPGLF